MNRRNCLGLLCSGCILSSKTETATPTPKTCEKDIVIEAPLQEMDISESLIWNIPEEFLQLLIVRLGADQWNAVWRICTHGNCDVEWDSNQEAIVCPCHNSMFSPEGLVLEGPATRDLNFYPICYDEASSMFFLQK
tara:strand:+ start:63 stop:470 length:408 start_codon:yes stop_codon:yes gene_type:complete